jgi:hypothetical protein
MRALGLAILAVTALSSAACDVAPRLDTRTFELQYLQAYEAEQLIAPYVYTDREGSPGMVSPAQGAITVRETADNLDKIARVLAQYDKPKPTVTLHFQIIEADGAAPSDPSIADVERELRRLFRFEGYKLVAETQVAAIQGTQVRQMVGDEPGLPSFVIESGVNEVRANSSATTLTLDVNLFAAGAGTILQTSVTVPAGHSVVLGTGQAPGFDGALILVVRAEVVDSGMDAQ